MGCCSDRIRRTAIVAATLLLSGCFTGHLVAFGRRREYVTEIRAVHPCGAGGVLVRCRTTVTDDVGREKARGERWITVSAEGWPLAVDAAVPAGPPLPACDAVGTDRAGACVTIEHAGDRELTLRIRDGTNELGIPAKRLTIVHVEPWVYPLVPVAAVVDVLSVPFILGTAPAILVVGD